MATYVNDLRLKEIATGGESGTWGTSTNTNLELIGEALSYGTQESFSSDADATTTIADGATDPARCFYFKVTSSGSLTATRTLTIAPNTVSRIQIIENATSGSQIITISQGSGASVNIPNGETRMVYMDGAGAGAAVVDALADINIGGKVTVGVDDTGYDVKFFGATSGAYMLWDESADDLKLVGAAGLTVAGDIDIDGTTNLDIVDVDGAVDMASTLTLAGNADFNGDLDVDGTTNLDVVDVDGAVNFAADVTYADGADIITASAGTSNFRAGVNAGNSIESGGNYNVVVGDEAGTAISTGDSNTFIGYAAGDANTTADDNVAVGRAALTANTTGAANTAVGYSAGTALTTGGYNVAVGRQALMTTTTVNDNVAVGNNALRLNATGASNTAVGSSALDANLASNNTAVGKSALALNTTGAPNVAVGSVALDANISGNYLCAVGYNSLGANTTGHRNTGLGLNAGATITTGGYNTAVGSASMNGATITGDDNVAIGSWHDGVVEGPLSALTSGGKNTAIGNAALKLLNSGDNNIGIGYAAGDLITTGEQNIIVGSLCDPSAADSDNQIVLGYDVDGNADDSLCFGSGTTDSAIAFGATSITAPSDIRLKEDIQDEVVGLDFINELRPVTFRWKKAKDVPSEMKVHSDSEERVMDGKYNHGFIAQEVKELIDNNPNIKEGFDMWSEDDVDGRQRIGEGALIPMLVKAVQELSAEVEELKSKLEE
jgi:hypothetical protein